MRKRKIIYRTKGYVTVNMPPITFPTPVKIVMRLTAGLGKAARRLVTSLAVRYLVLLLIGVGIGYFGQSTPRIPDVRPAPVRPVTETLENFAAREAGRLLTSDERIKLTAVTEKILQQHFTRPSAIEEEFRFQRRLAGINSPAFNVFADKWAAKVEEMQFEDSVEAMRSIYQSLLYGLQEVKSGDRGKTAADSASESSPSAAQPPTLLPSAVCGLPSLTL